MTLYALFFLAPVAGAALALLGLLVPKKDATEYNREGVRD